MRLRIGRAWILVGLAAAGAILFDGQEVQAKGGLSAGSGTTQPTGDPMYNYIFDVILLPDSTLDNGGFITIYDIPYLGSNPLTSQPNNKWGESIQDTGITPLGTPPITDNPTIPNITWVWNGSAIVNSSLTQSINLGDFTIGSTIELSSPPTPTLEYVGSLDGVNFSNMGIVTVSVPEPSSLILLVAGTGLLPLLYHCERQRRQRRSELQLQADA